MPTDRQPRPQSTKTDRPHTASAPVAKAEVTPPGSAVARSPAGFDKPAGQATVRPSPPPGFDREGSPPEKRPDPPKADPKSELKALNKEKTLFLDLVPTADGKKKVVRVVFTAEVVQTDAPLEVFLCRNGTKEHEAILRTEIDARLIHAALLAAGARPGSPVSFYNTKTMKPEYKPATGTTIDVLVHYTKGGKVFTHPAQEWILDTKTKKDMAYTWVFAGSRFLKNPDRPQDPEYYCANNGEMIGISNFVDSMLDLPVEVSSANEDLIFAAKPDRIPPLLSGVWVVLQPKLEKK
ncbi:MAG TPA: YdjY domain-containing protein [Fimbriiglobus sp.]